MATITKALRQWASRPDDERYTSLIDMRDHFARVRQQSRELVVSSRRVHATPEEDNHGLQVIVGKGEPASPTHWAFGQLATLAGAPAGYLRGLPSPLAADCINFGLAFSRDIQEIGVLTQRGDGEPSLRAATGPRYGRVWNLDVTNALVKRFGDGVSGQWKVPGEFGKAVPVTTQNTTLYASDRDCFVFLCDEDHRITLPNRRNGEKGALARGFFIWNSEVGDQTLGVATFLFDYVCMNRIIWGAAEYKEVRIRHTAGAPDRFVEELAPALDTYAKASGKNIVQAIEDARKDRLGDKVNEFLAERFSRNLVQSMLAVHQLEEGRPIESRWDAVVAATAVARGIGYQNERVELERKAGELLPQAA